MIPQHGTDRATHFLSMVYFFLCPITQARLIKIGPLSVVALIGFVSIGALLLSRLRLKYGTLLSDRTWVFLLGMLLFSVAIGIIQAPPSAYSSILNKLLLFCIPMAIVSLTALDHQRVSGIARAWVLGLVCAAVLQTYFEVTGDVVLAATYGGSWSRMTIIERDFELSARLGTQNMYGSMAMSIAAACLFISLLLAKTLTRKLQYGVVFIILVVGQSRGTFLVSNILLIGGVVISIVLYIQIGSIRSSLRSVPPVLLVLLLLFWVSSYILIDSPVRRIESMTVGGVVADSSAKVRFDHFLFSLSVWLKNPMLGIGLQGWSFDGEYVIGGHSSFVDVPAQLGIIGFIAYFGMVLIPLRRVFRSRRKSIRNRNSSDFSSVAIVGLSCFFIGSILNPTFMEPLLSETLFLLVCLGMLLGKHGIRVPRQNVNPIQTNLSSGTS